MSNILLSKEDVLNIPDDLLPMPVLSDNIRSFLAWGIKVRTDGQYNHFMWLIEPGILATQNLLYEKESVEKYFDNNRLKFWYCLWSQEQRDKIMEAINYKLSLPWYRRRYDVLAIAGQLFGIECLQVPWLDICSDGGGYLKLVDPRYNLDHPDPADVNRWLESKPEYQVYGRYVPD
jgi:hypothetical protein